MNELEKDIENIEDHIFQIIWDLDYTCAIHDEMIKERDFLTFCQTGKFPE